MSIEGNTKAALLTLPRELRDGIYDYLLLDQDVLTTTPKPAAHLSPTHSLHRKNTNEVAYIDTRIYLPIRPVPNVLGICRQLRAEYIDYINYSLSSKSDPLPISEPRLAVAVENDDSYIAEFKAKEKIAERERDDGSFRITIEIMRPVRRENGPYVPPRDHPSPRFMAIAPMFEKLRKVKIIVWAGWDWWFGPPKVRRSVQTKQQNVPTPSGGDGNDAAQSEPKKPDPLAVAISTLLICLPSVEEINIDVMMHGYEYCNMDLPENRWENVQGWLENPVHFQNGRTMKKIYRRMVVVDMSQDPIRSAAFYQKMETWEAAAHGESKTVVHVAEGHRVISEDEFFDDTPELAFTREYDRFE